MMDGQIPQDAYALPHRGPGRAANAQSEGSNDESPIQASAREFVSSAQELVRVSDTFLHRQADEAPYRLLGSAAAAGFVLGGGLATRLAGTLLAAAGRAFVLKLLTEKASDGGALPAVFGNRI